VADADLKIGQRRGKQVTKITETVDTLIDQRDRLGRVLGRHPIRRLIFLFPRHDSAEVNGHLRKQEARLREAVTELAIRAIASDVVLAAWTVPPYLKVEQEALERAGGLRERLPSVEVEPVDVERFRLEAGEKLVSTREKLVRRFGSQSASGILDIAIEDKLVSDEQEKLLEDRPVSYERYQRLKVEERRTMRRLTAEGATGDLSLDDLRGRLETQIEKRVPGVDYADISSLAAGVISSWLVECPLDFPDGELA
jgi:hypothetical protein